MNKRHAVLIASVRVPIEEPPLLGVAAWYLAAAITLALLTVGIALL